MKAHWFPVFQNIADKRTLVIGGGKIALRRVKTLLHFACHIHIITKELCPGLEKLIKENQAFVSVDFREFRTGDCTEGGIPFLTVAATNNRDVNHAIACECKEHAIPVSVADCKEEATFYFPAIIADKGVIGGLSSGGCDHHAVYMTAQRIRNALKRGTI